MLRLVALAGLLALSAVVPAAAEARRIAHGRDLRPADVGPEAIAAPSRATAGFTALKDGALPPFAREVPDGARYDGISVEGPHVLIEGITFTGRLEIATTRRVVVRGCRLRFADWFGILVRPGAGPALIVHNEIGAATTKGAPDDASGRLKVGIAVSGNSTRLLRNHILDSEDGIQVGGTDGTEIAENLIERLVYYKDAHPDGIQIVKSATRTRILRNKVLNPLPTTSAIIFDSRTGLVDDIVIDRNYLAGGGWTLYAGAHANGSLSRRVTITRNVFGRDFHPKSGHFGAITYWDPRQGKLEGNTFADGAPAYEKSDSKWPRSGSR